MFSVLMVNINNNINTWVFSTISNSFFNRWTVNSITDSLVYWLWFALFLLSLAFLCFLRWGFNLGSNIGFWINFRFYVQLFFYFWFDFFFYFFLVSSILQIFYFFVVFFQFMKEIFFFLLGSNCFSSFCFCFLCLFLQFLSMFFSLLSFFLFFLKIITFTNRSWSWIQRISILWRRNQFPSFTEFESELALLWKRGWSLHAL